MVDHISNLCFFTWTDREHRHPVLPFYLTAVAHQWFMHLSPTCKTSLKTVEEAIYQRFKPRAPVKREVLQIQQFPEESVEQYLFRVRKLAADSAMEESLITFFAMEGLGQELRTIVFPQDPQNMEDLWKSVRMAESAVAPTRSSVQPVAITDVFTSGLKDVVADMAAVMDSKLAQFNPRNESPRHNRTQTTSSAKNGDYICFNYGGESCFDRSACKARNSYCKYCNKKGHYAKVCHKRLLSNANIISNSKTSQ